MQAGDRVQLHPSTDLWMAGAKFGTIHKITRKFVHVRVDRNGKVYRVLPRNILEVVEK